MPDDTEYLNSTKALWFEQGNPIWVWLAIKSCSHNKHPYPQWVCDYLEKTAEQLLSDGAALAISTQPNPPAAEAAAKAAEAFRKSRRLSSDMIVLPKATFYGCLMER